jgi:hypothetical protein
MMDQYNRTHAGIVHWQVYCLSNFSDFLCISEREHRVTQ